MSVVEEELGEGYGFLTTPISLSTSSRHRHHHEREPETYKRNPFQTANPFDNTADLSDNAEQHSTHNHVPLKYQIRTGSRRGYIYSGSEELMDLPTSKLSIIPEESQRDVETPESRDSPQQSHDLVYQSRDLPNQSHNYSLPQRSPDTQNRSREYSSPVDVSRNSENTATGYENDSERNEDNWPDEDNWPQEDEDDVPWYQENSQDVWQTTPAYHRDQEEEVWPLDAKAHRRRGSKKRVRFNTTHKILVIEEMVPVLQVSFKHLRHLIN